MRVATTLILAAISSSALAAETPMTHGQALDAGKTFGASRVDSVRNAATGADLGAVPGYRGTELPETDYYDLGVGIEDAAREALPGHEVGSFVDRSATSRPRFTIDRDDPMVRRADAIGADPQSLLGTALTGEYSACEATTTTAAPATFTEERCTEWGINREIGCTTALMVTVDRINTCVANQRIAQTSAGPGLSSLTLRCTADKERLLAQFQFTPWCYWNYGVTTYTTTLTTGQPAQIIGPAPIDIWTGARTGISRHKLMGADHFRRGCFLALESGGCTGEECRYNFRFVDEHNWDDGWYPDSDRTFTLSVPPPERVTVTDRWDDGCATLERSTE